MRGTRGGGRDRLLGLGIIPADAGNTEGGRRSRRVEGDHPRGCGEHVPDFFQGCFMVGSSPRMRGTPQARRLLAQRGRIIPADAGNTMG